jgi:hypothetical protein
MTTEIKQQKTTDKMWTDEKGLSIPVTRIKGLEKLQEKQAYKLFKQAESIHKTLKEFKQFIIDASQEIYIKVMTDNDIKNPGKGNFTYFNFDRSIKIEIDINQNIAFDEALIAACQAKLNEFLSEEFDDQKEYLRNLVTDAFAKSRGALDAKKVMGLLKHKQHIKATKFHQACDLLEKSIRHPQSRTYYRVSYRLADGKYQVIDLNFSSI